MEDTVLTHQPSLPRSPLRIAAAQARSIRGDVRANAVTVAEMIDRAADEGIRLVMFPEKFLSGYEPDLIASNPEQYCVEPGDQRLEPIADACSRRQVCAIIGAATKSADGIHISSLVFGKTGLVEAIYHKQMLYGTEEEVFRRGQNGCILALDGWHLALGICYDSGFPEHARAAALNGSHAYLVSALFSKGNGFRESREWFPSRAEENSMYALMANHIGETGGWDSCGNSAAWSPIGELICEGSEGDPELVSITLDPEVLKRARSRLGLAQMEHPVHESASESFELYCL